MHPQVKRLPSTDKVVTASLRKHQLAMAAATITKPAADLVSFKFVKVKHIFNSSLVSQSVEWSIG